MKTLKLLILCLMFSVPLLAQQRYQSTIAATDSLGGIMRVQANEFFTTVTTPDSLTGAADSLADASVTLKFYVFNGDSAGVWDDTTTTLLETAGWAVLSEENDGSTDYSVTLVKNKITPLHFQKFAHLIGRGRRTSINQLYIIPYIVNAIGTAATLTFQGQKY